MTGDKAFQCALERFQYEIQRFTQARHVAEIETTRTTE